MLRYTTHQIREALLAGDLGQPFTLASKREQSDSTSPGYSDRSLFRVPRGQVALILSVCTQAGENKAGLAAAFAPSPQPSVAGLTVTNEDSDQIGIANFLSFRRPETFFMGTSTPTSRSAPPGNVGLWQPKYAFPIPGGCVVETNVTLGEFGNHGACDMVLVDGATAASMGYNVSANGDTSRHRLYGVTATSSEQTLVAGKAGLHIRLLDINIRLQPATAGAN